MPNRFAQASASRVRAAEGADLHVWGSETDRSREGGPDQSLRAMLVPFVVGCIVILVCLAMYAGW
jgi:hypothetical protein